MATEPIPILKSFKLNFFLDKNHTQGLLTSFKVGDFRLYLGDVANLGKKNRGTLVFSLGHLGGPNDRKSIGNQLLCYIDVIPQIDLPNRV